jgi:hypothetical protein
MPSIPTAVRSLAVLCFSAGIAATAAATTGEEWEYTQSLGMKGMKMPLAPMKVCEKADRDFLAPVEKRCQVTQTRKEGDKVHWKMSCAAPEPMEGTGWSLRKGDSIEAEMHIKTQNGEMDISSKGRKLGPCALAK